MENVIEIWKPIVGYEDLYEVSNMGRVKSLNYKKSGKEGFLSVYTMNTGYPATHLCKDGKCNCVLIHRLVAEHFIPNPENKPEIDHINCDVKDFRLENLRWVSSKENSNNPNTLRKHWSKNGGVSYFKGKIGKLNTLSKQVLQLDLNGDILKFWHSLMDIHRELNYDCGHISECCKGKRQTHKGYRWMWVEDYLADWWDKEMDKAANLGCFYFIAFNALNIASVTLFIASSPLCSTTLLQKNVLPVLV